MNVSQARRQIRSPWPIVLREHTANDIFVDLDAERMSHLLSDAHTAKLGIARLHRDDGRDEFRGWPFRPGLTFMG